MPGERVRPHQVDIARYGIEGAAGLGTETGSGQVEGIAAGDFRGAPGGVDKCPNRPSLQLRVGQVPIQATLIGDTGVPGWLRGPFPDSRLTSEAVR